VTLRGCIERCIEELVRRCPARKQAESRRDRVLAPACTAAGAACRWRTSMHLPPMTTS
jgi:hypothetical protein